MRYQNVLFDWDGCLAQTIDVWMSAFQSTFAEFDLSPTENEIAQRFGDWKGILSMGISEKDFGPFTDALLTAVNAELPNVSLYPGATELVESLKASGANLALVTTARPSNLDEALRNSGIKHHFDVVITAEDVTHHKPDAEPINTAMKKLGAKRNNTVMIGDTSKDLGAAINASIDSILVFPPEHEPFYDLARFKLYSPTFICNSLGDVKDVLLPQ